VIGGGSLAPVISAPALDPREALGHDPAEGDTEEIRPWSRMPGLDWVRGLAVVALVANHLLLVLPRFAAGLGANGERVTATSRSGGHGGAWWMTYTPLHLIWDATVAGCCFLLLSGLLLALPAASGRWPSWSRFYPGRAVRVGLPLLGAAGFASVWTGLLPGTFADTWQVLAPLGWVAAGSVLLPGLLRLALLLAPLGPTALVVPAMTLAIGDLLGYRWLTLLSVFAAGVQLAFLRDPLVGWVQRLWSRPNAREVAVLGAGGAVLLLNAVWLQLAFTDADSWLGLPTLGVGASVLGATAVVGFAASLSRVRIVRLPVLPRWLASRSFSLFLVHQPVLVGLAGVLGVWANLFSLLLFAVPVLVLVTEVFHQAVEAPSVRLADRVAGMAQRRTPQLRGLLPRRSALRALTVLLVAGPAARNPRMAIRPRHATDRVLPGPSWRAQLRAGLGGLRRIPVPALPAVSEPLAAAAFTMRRSLLRRRA
jgi:peptidoglycan/LPS O-acetylase OafA/YrhL